MKPLFLLLSLGLCLSSSVHAADERSFEIINKYCATCHGPGLSGGRAPALRGNWRRVRNDQDFARIIKEGLPVEGMPAFKATLDDAEIATLVRTIRSFENRGIDRAREAITFAQAATFKTELHEFRLEAVASDLEVPWSFAFLPDERLLVAERPGRLRIVAADGVSTVIEGTPEVWNRQDGGLFSVALHPSYAKNGWIYLAFAHPGLEPASSMTKVVRGQVQDGRWVNEQVIWQAPAEQYLIGNIHYGSRLLFVGDQLMFSIGDRGQRDRAQRLDSPFGKIHRINDDGTVPKDNPFADAEDAVKTIWTFGHRNPQGLTLDPQTGELWATEHGPLGGDELNSIQAGANYGWPLVTHGVDDDGSIISIQSSSPGTQDPAAHWSPSISPSSIEFYSATRFIEWENSLFLGSLTGQELRRIEIQANKVVKQEVLFKNLGRIRDIHTGPDGYLYVAIERFGRFGQIVRLIPATASRTRS
jgi:aldose sugar dehydrogenase